MPIFLNIQVLGMILQFAICTVTIIPLRTIFFIVTDKLIAQVISDIISVTKIYFLDTPLEEQI